MGEVEDPDYLVQELGCSVNFLPTTYLGLLSGMRHKDRATWGGVEEKFCKS